MAQYTPGGIGGGGGGGGDRGGGGGGFLLGRTGHDCRSRDIRRRLEVIQKKITDLQELGVPCAFCYVSVRNTGSLFSMGDHAITQVIEDCSDVILQQVSHSVHQQSITVNDHKNGEIRIVLPPLSGPIEELGFHELRTLIAAIIKDLQLKWTDPRPSFWPIEVPFQNPRTVSGAHQGYWIQALRKVVHSMYTYFHPSSSDSSSSSIDMSGRPHLHQTPEHHDDSARVPQLSKSPSSASPIESPDGISRTGGNFVLQNTCTDEEQVLEGATGNGGIFPEDEQRDVSDTETISVCSVSEDEKEGSSGVSGAVSYFGYEIATSECGTSPRPYSAHSSDHEDTDEAVRNTTASTAPPGVPPVLQPVFCYDPRLYSHLYPSSLQLPFLLPPNVLMNQVYQVPVTTAKTIPETKNESVISDGKKLIEKSREASTNTPLKFSFKLPKNSLSVIQNTSTSSNSKDKSTSTAKPQPTPQELVSRIRRSRIESDHRGRSRRNGIFIYTTPNTPPKFLSLNSRKEKAATKLVTGEPVSHNRGDPSKDSSKLQLHVVAPTERINGEQNSSSPRPTEEREASSGGKGGGKRFQIRRKRDLVFHWYQTPTGPQNPNKKGKFATTDM